ncbi:hypothetical protein CFN78_14345 [Amycolatopsis antarctica]|uniref:DUF4232 domain-containing protein n=1 Tax=Amycolatopsis antarctica TaxID=1854586 RepID=A0A263D3J5_9PSEU|nr:DUF4232 domain-containing protein [Amycolatopsis antarctica]OZM72789.1 hypothetical protein CFN78_14345 [Amycolatopsis antarctica]
MTTRTTLRRTAAALAVAGAAAGITALSTGTAAAQPTVFECQSNQISSKLVYGGAGVGNRDAAIEFTANEGERCTLPGKLAVGLAGDGSVQAVSDAPEDAPSVALTNGSSAHVPLHWTDTEPKAEQHTPSAIHVQAPADSNPHGDPVNPDIALPWTFGAVDASADQHTVTVGAVTRGPAPTV